MKVKRGIPAQVTGGRSAGCRTAAVDRRDRDHGIAQRRPDRSRPAGRRHRRPRACRRSFRDRRPGNRAEPLLPRPTRDSGLPVRFPSGSVSAPAASSVPPPTSACRDRSATRLPAKLTLAPTFSIGARSNGEAYDPLVTASEPNRRGRSTVPSTPNRPLTAPPASFRPGSSGANCARSTSCAVTSKDSGARGGPMPNGRSWSGSDPATNACPRVNSTSTSRTSIARPASANAPIVRGTTNPP